MHPSRWTIMIAAGLLALAPATASSAESEHERPISLEKVPASAVASATKALGARPTEAKTVGKHNGKQVYELELKSGSAEEQSVHVTSDGTIVKREHGAD